MLYSVSGKLVLKSGRLAAIENGGLAFKVFTNERTVAELPALGTNVKFFTHLNVSENALDIYGFLDESSLAFFEMLISVSGVGPKSALSIMDVAKLGDLAAAIKEGRPDLMTQASGIGTKTAERIILELRTKVQSSKSGSVVEKMQGDSDIVEALTNLGYRRDEARATLEKVDPKIKGTELRLKAALALLSKK
jgi:Holliday junction DNA helicase RuvA